MNKTLSLYLILTFLAVGCQKSSTPASSIDKSPSTIYLLTGYTNSRHSQSTTYKYDSKNRLIDKVSNFPSPNEEVKYTYDTKDKLVETDIYYNNSLSETDKYLYTNTNGVSTVQINPVLLNGFSNTSNTLTTFTLSSDSSRVIKATYSNSYQTFTYDNFGNMLTQTNYPNLITTTASETYIYTYDNHKSRFLSIKGNSNISEFNAEVANNILTYSYVSPINLSGNLSFTYSYTYNADGYPISRTSIAQGEMATETFTYTTIKL